jgi:hypothetical protein
LKEAIRQSLEDDKRKDSAPAASGGDPGGDLLDFLGGPPAAAPLPALPPSTSDPFAAPIPAALPASTSDPFAYGQKPPPSSSFGAAADPWSSAPAPAMNGYGYASQPTAGPLPALPPPAPAPAENGYGQSYGGTQAPAQPYYANPPAAAAQAPSYGAPAYGAPAPAPAQSWNVPAPISTQNYGGPPPSVTPHAQQTPSSLGFQSPQPDFSGFSPFAQTQEAATPAPHTAPGPMTMNALSGQGGLVDSNAAANSGSLADQAYAKIANMDTFTLASKKEETSSNPFFSSTSIGSNVSLADMQKTKVRSTAHILAPYLFEKQFVSRSISRFLLYFLLVCLHL